MPRRFILLGGAPTTGKSVMALKLAKHFNLPWIGTDQLREIIKPYGNATNFPSLFDSENITAEEFLTRYTAQEIADMEYHQGNDVWPAVNALIHQCTNDWPNGGIIEGVNILPHLVAETCASTPYIKAVFLVDLNEDHIRNVVYTRGLYDDASTYSDDVKPKEVEWALLFAHKLVAEANKHALPVVTLNKDSDDLANVLETLSST